MSTLTYDKAIIDSLYNEPLKKGIMNHVGSALRELEDILEVVEALKSNTLYTIEYDRASGFTQTAIVQPIRFGLETVTFRFWAHRVPFAYPNYDRKGDINAGVYYSQIVTETIKEFEAKDAPLYIGYGYVSERFKKKFFNKK